MSTRKVEHKAGKRQTLTLDELAAFVQDAMRSGANGDEHPHVQIAFSGKIQKVSVDVDSSANPVPDATVDHKG